MTSGNGIDNGTRVVAHDGRLLTLGQPVKSGGAGTIYRMVETPELVAKIYHPHVDHSAYERKVEAMLTLVPDLPDFEENGTREVQMAWPRLLLRDRSRRFLGFAMPLLDFKTSVELELVMQERQARAAGLPTGLGARITLATNLAGVIAELHRQGHYVVDLKPVNLRFYRRSLHVTMLDCDGFSIAGEGERFRAPQFTPEYLAPEFHARGLSESSEESQDRFALAVVVFQLLNFGIHPFTGRPTSDAIPTDIPGRIAKLCYAYGLRPNPRMLPSPASGHGFMPADLRALFDRAFEGGGSTRPSSAEWVTVLREYGQRSTGRLVTCATSRQHEHFAGMPCAACARAALMTKAERVMRPAPPPRRQYVPQPGAGAVTPPQPTPAPLYLRPKVGWEPFAVIGGILLMFALFAWIGTGKDSPKQGPISPGGSTTAAAMKELARYRAAAARRVFEEVLQAAQGGSMDQLVEQIHRLPGHFLETKREPECAAALAAWREKTRWIPDDPFFANDQSLSSWPRRRALIGGATNVQDGPCDDLYSEMFLVLRVQQLCLVAMHAPDAHPGPGATACREQGIIEAALDTLRRHLIWDASTHPYVWEQMAQAFVIADDSARAYQAFVVSGLLYRRLGLTRGRPLPLLIREPWLRRRGEILQATALAKLLGWYGEDVPPEIAELVTSEWPAEWADASSPSNASPASTRKKARGKTRRH
jgi:eukaryotic-like serine/threonine-protein kinase